MLLLIETQEFETGNCDKCVIIESCPYAYDGDKCMIKRSFPNVDRMSNGDLIKAMFPEGEVIMSARNYEVAFNLENENKYFFDLDWWNSIHSMKEVR